MDALFRIQTDRMLLTWSRGRGKDRPVLPSIITPTGLLIVRPRRPDIIFEEDTWRSDIPADIAHDPAQTLGPLLFEETDYQIYLESRCEHPVRLIHRDPLITRDLRVEHSGKTLYGVVNFRAQIGRSIFTIFVGDQPEIEIEVEVFPTKLDYQTDYRQILAEVQEIMTGLALEYLRATFRLGAISPEPQPTHLEWLTLLRQVISSLEQALRHIAQQPIRGLTREPMAVRADQVKRVDASIRTAIRRGAGSGEFLPLSYGPSVRQRLDERRPRPTLDTPEHKWLAAQLDRIRRRLGELMQQESSQPSTERRDRTIEELTQLESRIVQLRRLEPLASAEGQPLPGFASMQLISAAGYKEAYQACIILSLGLRLTDGILQLSVKDLGLLYEYWCYLALLRLIAEETGCDIPSETLLAVTQQGLQVLLKKGQQTTVDFDTKHGRRVQATYNQKFAGEPMLIPQQPDIVVSITDQDWPKLHLLLDAKYRIDASPEYKKQYRSPGPPEDALNILHRYRDAILETTGISTDNQPKRTVVQAAAVFPYIENAAEKYSESRLWQSLDQIGVGAIPLLPESTDYLREWLRTALQEGGWDLADRTIEHRTTAHAISWRHAAAEPVVIGTLSGGNEVAHLQWIIATKQYYMPIYPSQRRQYATRLVAIYSPTILSKPGAVTHVAVVEAIDIRKRKEIETPWPASHEDDKIFILYKLHEVIPLSRPVINRGLANEGQRVTNHRWTSRLGLDRARILTELLLETEPEWHLYEDLKAAGIDFTLDPLSPRLPNPENPVGRVCFVLKNSSISIRYTGDSGFLYRSAGTSDRYYASSKDVIFYIHRL